MWFILFFCLPKRKVTKEKGPTNTARLPAANRLATAQALDLRRAVRGRPPAANFGWITVLDAILTQNFRIRFVVRGIMQRGCDDATIRPWRHFLLSSIKGLWFWKLRKTTNGTEQGRFSYRIEFNRTKMFDFLAQNRVGKNSKFTHICTLLR